MKEKTVTITIGIIILIAALTFINVTAFLSIEQKILDLVDTKCANPSAQVETTTFNEIILVPQVKTTEVVEKPQVVEYEEDEYEREDDDD